jgi:hypothetical protein
MVLPVEFQNASSSGFHSEIQVWFGVWFGVGVVLIKDVLSQR